MNTASVLVRLTFGALLCGALAAVARAQDTNMYELKFHAICQISQGGKRFTKEKITNQTLIQEAANQNGLSDTSSLALVYHANRDERGDVIQVVNVTNGVPVWDSLALFFPEAITNGDSSEILQHSFVYNHQQSDPVGDATIDKRMAFDRNGDLKKVRIRGSIQYFMLADPTNVLRVCTGTFATGKLFVPIPAGSNTNSPSGRGR